MEPDWINLLEIICKSTCEDLDFNFLSVLDKLNKIDYKSYKNERFKYIKKIVDVVCVDSRNRYVNMNKSLGFFITFYIRWYVFKTYDSTVVLETKNKDGVACCRDYYNGGGEKEIIINTTLGMLQPSTTPPLRSPQQQEQRFNPNVEKYKDGVRLEKLLDIKTNDSFIDVLKKIEKVFICRDLSRKIDSNGSLIKLNCKNKLLKYYEKDEKMKNIIGIVDRRIIEDILWSKENIASFYIFTLSDINEMLNENLLIVEHGSGEPISTINEIFLKLSFYLHSCDTDTISNIINTVSNNTDYFNTVSSTASTSNASDAATASTVATDNNNSSFPNTTTTTTNNNNNSINPSSASSIFYGKISKILKTYKSLIYRDCVFSNDIMSASQIPNSIINHNEMYITKENMLSKKHFFYENINFHNSSGGGLESDNDNNLIHNKYCYVAIDNETDISHLTDYIVKCINLGFTINISLCKFDKMNNRSILYLLDMLNSLYNLFSNKKHKSSTINVYMELWNVSIECVLTVIKKRGDFNIKIFLFVPDLFMKRLKYSDTNSTVWSLFECSTYSGKALIDSTGKRFERLYMKYESQRLYERQLGVDHLWSMIIKNIYSKQKTLQIIFKDNMKRVEYEITQSSREDDFCYNFSSSNGYVYSNDIYLPNFIRKECLSNIKRNLSGDGTSSSSSSSDLSSSDADNKDVNSSELASAPESSPSKVSTTGSVSPLFVSTLASPVISKSPSLKDEFLLLQSSSSIISSTDPTNNLSTVSSSQICRRRSKDLKRNECARKECVNRNILKYDRENILLNTVSRIYKKDRNKTLIDCADCILNNYIDWSRFESVINDIVVTPLNNLYTRNENLLEANFDVRFRDPNRRLSIGIRGLTTALLLFHSNWNSEFNDILNVQLYKRLYYYTLKASCDYGLDNGCRTYENFKRSNLYKGFFKFETIGLREEFIDEIIRSRNLNWEKLRDRIIDSGLANDSLLRNSNRKHVIPNIFPTSDGDELKVNNTFRCKTLSDGRKYVMSNNNNFTSKTWKVMNNYNFNNIIKTYENRNIFILNNFTRYVFYTNCYRKKYVYILLWSKGFVCVDLQKDKRFGSFM